MASEGGQGSLAPLDFEIFSKKGCFLSVAVTQERSNATGTCRCKTRKGEKTSAAEDSMLKKITSATASESSLWPNRLARLHHQRLPQSVLPKFEHEKHTMPFGEQNLILSTPLLLQPKKHRFHICSANFEYLKFGLCLDSSMFSALSQKQFCMLT